MLSRSIQLAAVTACFFLGTLVVQAAEVTREMVPLYGISGDFVVGPGKVEFLIPPGETRTTDLIVTNRLGDETTFSLTIEDAAGSTDPRQSIRLLGAERGPYSIQDYVTFPDNTITLAHGERARIPVTVAIPADAEPGGYYGSVLVSVASETEVQDAGESIAAPKSVLVSRVGALYFVRVPGDVVQAGELKEFTTIPSKQYFSSGPIDFEVLFENTGNVHLNPYGEITIKNMFGEVVGFVELAPWYAMPKSLRYFEATFDRTWLFGRYTAELELYRGYEDRQDSATYTFYVVPVIVWAFLGLLFVVIVGIVYYRRNKK